MLRVDGRNNDQLRKVRIIRKYNKYAEGSALIEMGDTRVIATASVDDKVPPFLKGTGKGWVTAEYAMLPRATQTRNQRESVRGKINGRSQEIQRLIGRALRAVVNLDSLNEHTIWIDCDVLQADGGTRTASITAAFVALVDALTTMRENGKIDHIPIKNYVAAVSVGIVDGEKLLDLCFEEDSKADVDMNVVMTDDGNFIEVQGTAEHRVFSMQDMNELLQLAHKGIRELINMQRISLGKVGVKENWR